MRIILNHNKMKQVINQMSSDIIIAVPETSFLSQANNNGVELKIPANFSNFSKKTADFSISYFIPFC